MKLKVLLAFQEKMQYEKSISERTLIYWKISKRIFDEEQAGKDRADYGKYIIKFLAEKLQPEFGSGFSYRNPISKDNS